MLAPFDISELIGNASGFTNHFVNISMRMPVNPVVDRIRFYKIGKLNSKGSVYPTVHEVWRLQLNDGT